MNLFYNTNVDSQLLLVLFFLISILGLFFVNVIYFINRSYKVNKSLVTLIYANVALLVSVAFMFFGKMYSFSPDVINSILNNLKVTFWIVSIYTILDITYSKKTLYIINGLFIALILCCIFFDIKSGFIRGISFFLIAAILTYCTVKSMVNKKRKTKSGVRTIEIVLIISSLFFVYQGITILTQTYHINSIFISQDSITSIIIIFLLTNTMLHFAILYIYFLNLLLEIKETYYYDPMTKAYTKSHFMKLFEQKLNDIKRNKNKIALCMIDLDNFKKINDVHGHLIGDEVLTDFCQHLIKQIRKNDVFGRYGGEEFILLIEYFDEHDAYTMCHRILKNMTDIKLSKKQLTTTFSCGMVFIDKTNTKSTLELIGMADTNLYKAKAEGKNRIIMNADIKNKNQSFFY